MPYIFIGKQRKMFSTYRLIRLIYISEMLLIRNIRQCQGRGFSELFGHKKCSSSHFRTFKCGAGIQRGQYAIYTSIFIILNTIS